MADERIKLELDLNQFTASAKEGTAALQNMAVVADQNVVPAIKHVDDATQQATRSKQQFGSTVLYASYAVQDFTSQLGTRGLLGAFAAIQNNIPQILVGLGAGPGLAGIISVASVAVGAAVQNMGLFGTSTKEAAAATKELADQAERLKNLKSPEQEKQEKSIADFIKEQPGGVIAQGIKRGLERRALPQAQQQVRESIEQFGVVQETEEQVMARFAPDIQKNADAILRGAGENEADLGMLLQLAIENPGAFPPGFANQIKKLNDFKRKKGRKGEISQSAWEYGTDDMIQGMGFDLESRNKESRGRRAASEYGTEAAIDELNFAYGEGPYATGNPPRPFANFFEMQERRKGGSVQMGNNRLAIERARAAGVMGGRYPEGTNPRAARARANDDATALSRRAQPNAFNAQGAPAHDPSVEALMGEVEKLQGLVGQSHRYISSNAQRLAKIRARNGQLEQQSQQLNNTGLDRGR